MGEKWELVRLSDSKKFGNWLGRYVFVLLIFKRT